MARMGQTFRSSLYWKVIGVPLTYLIQSLGIKLRPFKNFENFSERVHSRLTRFLLGNKSVFVCVFRRKIRVFSTIVNDFNRKYFPVWL